MSQTVVLLSDYRPPAWRAREIALEFDLDLDETLVAGRLVLEQDPAQVGAPLRLDAERMQVLEVKLDGRTLAAHEFSQDASSLTLPIVGSSAVVETRVRIAPAANTELQGLYASGTRDRGFLLTQCEAEGMRRITPCLDRPDVLARYTVTLRAERARYPLLLSNGNADGAGDLADGRHWARFVDPHPKPSYLFAVVAGRLACVEDAFVTAQGRCVRIAIHAEADVIARCGWAMECVKMAMRWDEQRFGRCYDLDVFHIVATHDFTMGAMENKGLNIFNAKYLLADPEHATDDDYRHVLAVVGHEYFHNWSGNRVTCRDWFQLSLKEGLTVYREQEFEADLASRTLRRIEDVRTLWRAQFGEDAGPLAHPVRPDRYSEINNFYTATVYEKGAEIVRMLATRLGREGFRRGLDLYFERHDGGAATIEDFLAALGEANGVDLSPWLSWYCQAGTPELHASGRYDARARRYELSLRQHTAPTPGQPRKRALPIPLGIAMFDAAGNVLPLRLDGDDAPVRERVLTLTADASTYRFIDVASPPVVSLLRGYSAPVRLGWQVDVAELALQARYDDDGFNRWFAVDTLWRRLFARLLSDGEVDARIVDAWVDSLTRAFADAAGDPALLAEMLTLADANSLADDLAEIEPERVHAVRSALETLLAVRLQPSLLAGYAAAHVDGDDTSTALAAQGRRRLRNACLAALCRADAGHLPLAEAQYAAARNLTDRLAALAALLSADAASAPQALDAFAERYADDALVLDKWLSLQALQARAGTLERVQALTQHAAFRWTNPNNVYALLGSFALRNQRGFHRADGSGYRFVADSILRLDALTPQVAARLATAFGPWRRFEPVRRALMQHELRRIATRRGNSADLADIVARSLGDAAVGGG